MHISGRVSAQSDGITFFAVTTPSRTEGEVFTSGSTMVTSRRLAMPQSGSYINFTQLVEAGAPCIVSFRQRRAEADTATLNVANLPVQEHDGRVEETIAFPRMLSNTERQRVDSYLAFKYGITLDQRTPRSYLSPDGRVVWDAVSLAAHTHRVAALCHDTISALYRCTARSSAPEALLTLCADTILPRAYVALGDDNGSLKYEDSHGRKRLGRTWRMSAVGPVPERIVVSLDASQIHEVRPLEQGESYWLSIGDTAYVKSANLGMYEARFDSVPVAHGTTLSLIAAKGDDEPDEYASDDISAGAIRGLSVAPNPTTDGLVRVRLSLRSEAKVVVELRSADGRMEDRRTLSGADFYDVTLTLPSQGAWLVTVRTSGEVQTLKLLRK